MLHQRAHLNYRDTGDLCSCICPRAAALSRPRMPTAVVAAAATPAATAAAAPAQSPSSIPAAPPAKSAVHLDPEVKAKHTRPQGWVAPGPQPAAAAGASLLDDPELSPGPDETLSYLTGDWRIFQLKTGHRWSMDDMMTAYVALQTVQHPPLLTQQPTAAAAAPPAAAPTAGQPPGGCLARLHHVLDLGCGIGSVLLMVAWGLRRLEAEQQQQQPFHISSLGVEAQAVSYGLAVRSIRYNLGHQQQQQQQQQGDAAGAAGGLVQVCHQDLRQPLPPLGPSVLPAGDWQPPYIPLGAGGQSDRPQKGPCCLEIRGGIEDYCAAAAAVLAPGGHLVVCCGLQGQPFKGRRAQLAATSAGLVIVRQVTVVTKEGKPPLFAVYVMQHAGDVLGAAAALQQQGQEQAASGSSSGSSDAVSLLAAQVAAGQLQGVEELFVVRDAAGQHTAAWHAAREAMGLPPLQQ